MSKLSNAQRFEHVRIAHQKEIAEDYVEMIHDLITENGEARAIDLANAFGVTSATVNNTVQRLQRDGLVVTQPYRSIFLTDKGANMAQISKARHNIVMEFLLSLGVSQNNAELDAEGIEHHVSDETLNLFKKFTLNNSN